MAGFIEPAESFEDAVKREMREEAGIEVLDVQYHSGEYAALYQMFSIV